MVIQSLPVATSRLLGASASITSPSSLAKELIDNAIDADATSIEIQVSADTLAKIQVRDNGWGINLDDLNNLAKRSHTSKLTSFEQLQTGKVATLGFRGDALAHANMMSNLSITTRTKQDPVGTRADLKFGEGGVLRMHPVSSTVGTTVRATDLFKTLPVRKQNHLKEGRKPIAKIKEQLQAYALGHPQIKFSLKVLGETKESWDYCPMSGGTTYKAAVQLFGKDVSIKYDTVSATSKTSQLESLALDPHGFSIEAILPKPEHVAAPVKSNAFLCVDQRPISPTRGFGKKLVSIVKKHIKQSTVATKLCSQMFICVHIRCPPGSYDPNLTPMKDEVVIHEEHTLLDMFERMCGNLYRSKIIPNSTSVARTPTEADLRSMMSSTERLGVATRHFEDTPVSVSLAPTCRPNEATDEAARTVEDKALRHSQSKLVRTAMSVNMLRTVSDTTDDACKESTIPVRVVRLSSPITKKPPSVAKKLTLTPAGTSVLSEDIQRYFLPKGSATFDIAEDDTAMPDGPKLVQTPTATPSVIHHPLRRMTEAALNEDHDRDCASDESVDGEVTGEQSGLDLPHSPRLARGDLDGLDHEYGRLEQPARRNTRIAMPTSPLNIRRGLHPLPARSVRHVPSAAGPQAGYAFRTPPSSASRRTRGENAPISIPAACLGQEMKDSETIGLGMRAFAGCGPTGPTPTSASLGNLVSSFRPLTLPVAPGNPRLPREAFEKLKASPDVDMSVCIKHATSSSQGTVEGGMHDGSPDCRKTQWAQRSRQAQLELVQTSTPEARPANGRSQSSCWSQPTKRTAEEAALPMHRNVGGRVSEVVEEDARQYLIKRQRSMASDGRRKRMLSKKLPLENILDATYLLQAVINGEAKSVRLHCFADPFNERLSLAASLEASGELDLMEKRLAAIISLWAEQAQPGLSVTWTLRANVKGKCKTN
ncbi:histidine kinase-, DNA gyrase b-, and HSP90-like ATPase domain-containing protein [Sarocladium implicatum]|nr:histidine kinase-, DNA gyrase b-, and HSP90-like ATPase domain-containing protein [Sarocladium implicatum]